MKRIILAFQFLTIVPVKVGGDVSERDMAGAAVFFPFVGAFQGLIIVLASLVLLRWLPSDITAGLVIVLSIIANGGFDLDGLADTVDALAVKPTGEAEADKAIRLSVMKDSSIGAMGVIALITAVLLKFLFISRLLAGHSPYIFSAVLFLMPAVSKWVTVPAMHHGTSARNDGLGRIFIAHTGSGAVLIASVIMIILFSLAVVLNHTTVSLATGLEACAVLLVSFYVFCLLSVRFFMKRFGGLTGDHFGALTEVSEILFLLAATLWLRHSTS